MRRSLFVSTVALLAAFTAQAAPEDEIRQAEKSWASAVAAGDHAAVERMLGDQLIYAHSTGIVETKSEYMAKLRSGDQKYEGIEHKPMKIHVYGDTAVMHSGIRMKGKTKGVPFDNQLMVMHTWVKQNGKWQLAAHQTTKLP